MALLIGLHGLLGSEKLIYYNIIKRYYPKLTINKASYKSQSVQEIEDAIVKKPNSIWILDGLDEKTGFKSLRSVTDSVIIKFKKSGDIIENEIPDEKCDEILQIDRGLMFYEDLVKQRFDILLDRGDYSVFR